MTMVLERAPSDLNGDLFDGGGAVLADHHAEEQMLGYLLNKPGAITETMDVVRPHDLHDPLNRVIYDLLIRAYDIDSPPTMETLVAGLGGEKSAAATVARLIADADMHIAVDEVAEYLFALSERRAVGAADDIDFDHGKPFVSKFGAITWEEIGAAGSPAYGWAIEDVLPLGEITLAFGDSGSGKSFAMFDMSLCIARNIKFTGHNVEPGLVIYVAAEAGKGFSKRKVAYSIQHSLEPSDPLPFVLMTKRPDFFHDDADAVALIEEIGKICRRYTARLILIVIDTLSALAPGMNENASADVSMVRKRLMMLQDSFNSSVVLVHHMPKNGSGTPRGHGSLTADFETTIKFETICDKKTETGLPIHRATIEKQREGKKHLLWEFTLPIIEVGINKWGNPETSCAVQPYVTGAPRPGAVGFHATPTEMLFMRALYDALVDHPLPTPAGLPKSITHVVDFKHVRALMRERFIPPHEDNEIADNRFRVAFKRAGDKLRDGAVIGVQGALVWPTGKPVNGFSPA
jgi:hypothetical protein